MAAKENDTEENISKMDNKILVNNSMIRYEKMSEKELVAAYF